MVSGKYSAISGAVAREQAMNNLAANLANVHSNGFKRDRISFSAILKGSEQNSQTRGINYTRVRTIGTDQSQGAMETTGRPLDVAIDGPGFFKVSKDQEIYYTRAGRLQLDQNGMLKTNDGASVLGAGNEPLQIDTALGKDILIAENGDISVNGEAAGARLQVFTVEDQSQMSKAGDSLFRLKEGAADLPAQEGRVLQGNLEISNVNMVEEMTAMIGAQRTFEAHIKVIESYSTIGQKQEELGTIA